MTLTIRYILFKFIVQFMIERWLLRRNVIWKKKNNNNKLLRERENFIGTNMRFEWRHHNSTTVKFQSVFTLCDCVFLSIRFWIINKLFGRCINVSVVFHNEQNEMEREKKSKTSFTFRSTDNSYSRVSCFMSLSTNEYNFDWIDFVFTRFNSINNIYFGFAMHLKQLQPL